MVTGTTPQGGNDIGLDSGSVGTGGNTGGISGDNTFNASAATIALHPSLEFAQDNICTFPHGSLGERTLWYITGCDSTAILKTLSKCINHCRKSQISPSLTVWIITSLCTN